MRLSNLKPLAFVGVSALAAGAVFYVSYGAENRFFDTRMALRHDSGWPADLEMVAIDDPTLAEYGRWPWPREQTGAFIEAVKGFGAKTIYLDIIFAAPSTKASDDALEASLRKTHPVLGIANTVQPGDGVLSQGVRDAILPGLPGPEFLPIDMAPPLPAFIAASGHLGHSVIVPEAGEARGLAPLLAVPGTGGALPSSALVAFLLQRGFTAKDIRVEHKHLLLPTGARIPLEDGQFRFDLAPGGVRPATISARDILHAAANPGDGVRAKVVRRALDQKLALIYLDNQYAQDLFTSADGPKTPGAKLLAYAIRTFDSGRVPRGIPVRYPLLAVMLLGLLGTLPLARRPPGIILGAGVGAAAVYLVVSALLVRWADQFLPAIAPCFFLLCTSGLLAAYAGRVGELEREQMRALLTSVKRAYAADEERATVEKATIKKDLAVTRPGARVEPGALGNPGTDPVGGPAGTGSRQVELGVGTETRRGSQAVTTRSGAELLVGGNALDEPVQIGQYEVQRPLGRGGMGAIFLAIDRDLDRPVAIKILESVNKDTYVRFRREAMAVARISHPNVVQVYEVGLDSSVPFIVMEYVAGGTLSDLMRDPDVPMPLPWDRATRIVSGVAKGLGAAHLKGIVHRDLKPANILLVSRKTEFPKLADFGIAKLSGADQLTREGLVVGTVGYLAPEQALGKQVSPKSDVYSLAVMYYRMLTGHRAFEGTTEEMLRQSVTRSLPDPRDVNPAIPSAIAELLLRMGSLDPEPRPRDGNVVAQALDLLLNEAVGAKPPANPA